MDCGLVATSEASTHLAAGAGARGRVSFHWRSPERVETRLGEGMVQLGGIRALRVEERHWLIYGNPWSAG